MQNQAVEVPEYRHLTAVVGQMRMKQKWIIMFLVLSAGLALAAETNAPAVTIPKGIVAASSEQKALTNALARLPLGASKAAVLQTLGNPSHTNATSWFYTLDEDRTEGGYYVTVSLTFGTNGLTGGTVGFGHKTLMRKEEE